MRFGRDGWIKVQFFMFICAPITKIYWDEEKGMYKEKSTRYNTREKCEAKCDTWQGTNSNKYWKQRLLRMNGGAPSALTYKEQVVWKGDFFFYSQWLKLARLDFGQKASIFTNNQILKQQGLKYLLHTKTPCFGQGALIFPCLLSPQIKTLGINNLMNIL